MTYSFAIPAAKEEPSHAAEMHLTMAVGANSPLRRFKIGAAAAWSESLFTSCGCMLQIRRVLMSVPTFEAANTTAASTLELMEGRIGIRRCGDVISWLTLSAGRRHQGGCCRCR